MMETVQTQQDWTAMQRELTALEEEIKDPKIWEEDTNRAVAIQKQISKLEQSLSTYTSFRSRFESTSSLLDLLIEDPSDSDFAEEVLQDLESLKKELEAYTFRLLMRGPQDSSSCFIEIRAGAGGTGACDWAQHVLRMYERWGTKQGYQVTVVDEMEGEVAGIKSAVLEVKGEWAYGWLKHEGGVHRFVSLAKFSNDAKRQTSFVSVQVLPFSSSESSNSSPSDIPPGDLKIEVMR
ncbi:hypothetical protein HDV05_008086, partial [Chytridiales sp. JEL 0842]